LGTVPRSINQAANEIMEERIKTTRILKEQLERAQHRMKRYANKNRTYRNFKVGDWVYLKLQPYWQISVQGKTGA
jgi:hypothetical protein